MSTIAQGSAVPGTRVLVIEDEPAIQDLLAMSLAFVGYEVERAGTAADARRTVETKDVDLALVDVMLPDGDGFALLDDLRHASPGLPAIFVTARDALDDRLSGLSIGDDYVTKPFSLEEVIARVAAVLRRTCPPPEDDHPNRLRVADLILDDDTHEVRRAGHLLQLSPTEFALLRYLMRNSGQVVTKTQILSHVWDYDFHGSPNVVESYISYLRRKVDATGAPLIHTIRGVGYSIRQPSS